MVTRYAEPKVWERNMKLTMRDGNSFTHKTWPRFESECPTCGKGDVSQWEIFQYYQEKK